MNLTQFSIPANLTIVAANVIGKTQYPNKQTD